MNPTAAILATTAVLGLVTGRVGADVIAATGFDGRVLSPLNTATNLNWTTHGVDDPGNMAALNAASAAQPLFNGTELTQNNFTPALNTGNGNTFWTTTVSLTVATGFAVTVTDVVFDYVPTSASQALNVSRRSDFTVKLFNPAGDEVGTVDIVDAPGGFNLTPPVPTLTATFPTPIALTEPGAYTLHIKGGDYLGNDETGNHTGIDNLSINGIVAGASNIRLVITRNGDNYDFSWNSQPGKQYDLLTSTDLATRVAEWPVYHDGVTLHENIPAADATTTTLTAVPSGDPRRFFALREKDIPPPPPLLWADFEADDGGFTTSKAAGTDWAWGTPDSSGVGGTVNSGNGTPPSAKCWGTNLGNPGFYVNPTTASRLISPVIDLTAMAAATLSFAQALDFPLGDSAVVRIFNATTGDEIVQVPFPLAVTDDADDSALWQSSGPLALPVGAPIRIEWQFSGTGGDTADYMGWYIDDVLVTGTP